MDSKKDGGPAYPATRMEAVPMSNGQTEYFDAEFSGMSLRDWFAGQVIASGRFNEMHETYADDAMSAYLMADAMIAARGAK